MEDLAGIRQIIKPLEESGTLVRRTDEEVSLLALALGYTSHCFVLSIKGLIGFWCSATASFGFVCGCGKGRTDNRLCGFVPFL